MTKTRQEWKEYLAEKITLEQYLQEQSTQGVDCSDDTLSAGRPQPEIRPGYELRRNYTWVGKDRLAR